MESLSLQESFAQLYQRSDLGVALADETQIFDANDAALRMLGFTREELRENKIDWVAMTPQEFAPMDERGLQQLRDFGVCVPFEKEYRLRDGTRLPLMIGAVRLTEKPLSWAAYMVSLKENRRLAKADRNARDIKVKHELINELAHELNNPLAGLTFVLHLLRMRPDCLTEDSQKLLRSASDLVDRLTTTVQRVLAATDNGNGSEFRV